MMSIIRRILGLFRPFWKPLALISLLIMMQKVGDLAVPLLGGQVIDAMARHESLDAIYPMVAVAFIFWVCHGNLLPYVLGRVDLAGFQYAGPRHLGVSMLRRVLRQRLSRDVNQNGRDTAMQQAIVERGEIVLVQFVNAFVRVAVPVTIPAIVTLGLLLWWYPLIGLIAIVGGALDVLATIYLNSVLKPLYQRLQQLDYERQRWHTHVFRNLLGIIVEDKQAQAAAEYDQRFGTYAGFGAFTGRRFLAFNFGRGLIINVTNLCTWVVGVWYVDGGVYSLGYFLASLNWSTYVLNCVGAGIELQKQWMETMPAIRAFFAEIDACDPDGAEPEGSVPAGSDCPVIPVLPAAALVAAE